MREPQGGREILRGEPTPPITEMLAETVAGRGRVGISDVSVLNPAVGRIIDQLVPATDGVTRDKLTVPVATVPTPGDTSLYESPDDPNRKLFLPRYRVVDKPPLQLSLAQGAQDWALTVELGRYPAPELCTTAQGASEVPHTASVVFRHNLLTGDAVAGVKELELSEVTNEPNGIRAVLRGQQTALRDQLFLAMTDPKYSPSLLVRRVASIALPIPGPGSTIGSGEGTLRGTWMFSFDAGAETGAADADVWWDQMTDVARQLVPQGIARIVNLGAVDFDSIGLAQLEGYAYGSAPIPGSADATNQLVQGDVFAVHTTGGNYTKVQVTSYGYNLGLRWVTFGPATPHRPILFARNAVLAQHAA